MNNCNKIKMTCGESTYAECVNYETELPEFSEIEDCASIEDTTTETYKFLGEIRDQTDLSELGESCLTYVKEEDKIIVKNVLLKFEQEICDLRNRVSELETINICEKSIVACDFSWGVLTDTCGEQPITMAETIQLILDKLNQ